MLFLIILFIICVRIFGWSVRVMGRLFGGFLGLIIAMAILGSIFGAAVQLLPIILIGIGIYYLVRRPERNENYTPYGTYREM